MLAFISTPFVFLSFFAIGSFGLPLPARQEATGKLVVAHHMVCMTVLSHLEKCDLTIQVGNTFPYTQQDWADDMALASANGIDGFALNYGPEEFNNDQLDNAYVVSVIEPSFKLERLQICCCCPIPRLQALPFNGHVRAPVRFSGGRTSFTRQR
jgi:hypothetical protein